MSTVERPPAGSPVLAVLDAMEDADPGSRAEHIGGVFTLNRPSPIHQATALEHAVALRDVVPGGYRVIAEVRVNADDTWITPDILVVPESIALSETSPVRPDDVLLMCEVLSPSTETKDRTEKRAFAERHGID
jgi:Uma2 family endonuclease